MTRRPILVALLASLLVAPALRAEAPPAATPESVGLSSERLQRLRAVMQQLVDEGRVAGIVTYVARNGRVAHLEAFGERFAQGTGRVGRLESLTKGIDPEGTELIQFLAADLQERSQVFHRWHFGFF